MIGILGRKSGCLGPEAGGGPKGLSGRSVAVAEAADGLDRCRPGWVRGELAAQVADVELDLVAGGGEGVAPDELAELVVTQHLVRVGDEGDQEPVFERREDVFSLVVANGALIERYAEPRVGVTLLRGTATWTTKEHLDTRDQFLASERLDHVVVGSTSEPADSFQLGVTRSQHQHGDVRHFPDPVQRRPPVETPHRDAEDHEIGRGGVELAQTRASVWRLGDLVSRALEQSAQKPADVVVVVDYEDPGTGNRIPFHRRIPYSCDPSTTYGR